MTNFTKTYFLKQPPRILRTSCTRLDNIALIPASMLPFKNRWQEMANNLPSGSVFICHSTTNLKQKEVLERVEALYRAKGHRVTNLSTEQLL